MCSETDGSAVAPNLYGFVAHELVCSAGFAFSSDESDLVTGEDLYAPS